MLTECPTDCAELLRRVSANDLRAVGGLYDRFGAVIFRLAYRLTGERAAAEDAVQGAFVWLWRHAGEFERAGGAPSSWVVRTAWEYLVRHAAAHEHHGAEPGKRQ